MHQPSSARHVARLTAAAPAAAVSAAAVTSRRLDARRGGLALASLILCAALAACAIPKHPDATAEAPDPFNPAAVQLLDNTSWTLASWRQAGGAAREIPHGADAKPITLTLSTADGRRRASGFSGCNRYMGTYDLKDGGLGFGPLAGTKMACATPGGELESAYLDALAHISRTGVQMKPPQQLELVLQDGDTLIFDRADQGS